MNPNECWEIIAASLAVAAAGCISGNAQAPLFNPAAKQKAEAFLKQMAVEEKIGQLNESSGMVIPGIATEKPDDLIAKGRVGSIFWQMNVQEINRLQHIVADVLFGDVNLGGKLPVNWPRTARSEPLYYNHTRTHDHEDAPRFTSRHWAINSKPLYPFGYGLSHSTFKFANLQLSNPACELAIQPR